MRTLNIIKTGIDLWMQRHHEGVAATCLIIIIVTMLMDINLCIQSYLDFLVLLLWMAVCVTFYYGYQLEIWHDCIDSFVKVLRSCRFASFIVRRLLYQLHLASQRLPKPKTAIDLTDPAIQHIFEQVQKDAYQAVQLFWRDANALLEEQPFDPLEEFSYFVPEDEDEELKKAGFSDTLKLRLESIDIVEKIIGSFL